MYFISKSVSGSIAIWRKNNLEDMHWDKYFLEKNVLFVKPMNFVFHKQVCIWLRMVCRTIDGKCPEKKEEEEEEEEERRRRRKKNVLS